MYVQRNVETRSRNHCGSAIAMSIAYCECVRVCMCMSACVCACVRVCVCMSECVSVCVCVCVCE